MKKNALVTLAAIAGLALAAGAVLAQTSAMAPAGAMPVADSSAMQNPAIAPPGAPSAGPLTAGHNSFTQAQARSRITAAGYRDVNGLALDGQGLWQAQATLAGAAVNVALDYKGDISTH
jgi:zona occludens toxin (predicted ATPase)